MGSQLHRVEIKVYRKRWLVLILFIWLQFLSLFAFINFGYLNMVFVAYFHISYAEADWLMLGYNIGIVTASPVIAFLALKNILSCKKAMITASILLIIGFTFIIIGFLLPLLYFFITIGQTFNGIVGAILSALPELIAQLWFDETQIGLATGLSLLGLSTAGLTADFLPPQLLKYNKKRLENIQNSSAVVNYTSIDWNGNDSKTYEMLFLTMLLTVVLALILFCTLIPEKPKRPPSMAQYFKTTQIGHLNIKFRDFVFETKNLMSDYQFIISCTAASLVFYLAAFDDLTVEQIVTKLTLKSSKYSPEEISGFLMATLCTGGLFANVFSGFVLDKYKRYYWQTNISAFFVLITVVALLVSVYCGSIVGLIISHFFTGFSKRTCYISLIDSIMQHTYPTNPLFVMSIGVFVQNVTAILFINVGRQIIYSVGLINGLVYLCVLMFLVCLLCFSFNPDTKRLNAGENQSETESAPLLSN